MSTAPAIKARKMNFPFDSTIPRHWVAGSPLLTHMSNGLNLLFPKGERFFIRSVRAFADRIEDDPVLKAQVKGFMAQEVRHGIEHERFFEILTEQGYDIEGILEQYDKIAYEVLEPLFPPEVRLSVTVALEHFTALFGELALTYGMEHSHPTMASLLMWHAAEEIEHKSVAFDVLKRVNPSYPMRISGLLIATIGLLAFWFACIGALMKQESMMDNADVPPLKITPREIYAALVESRMFRGMARGFVDYLRPDFHPDQHDNYALAHDYLVSVGRL